MDVMSNRDHLVDGLHSILEELWRGSDRVAASEFRTLMAWRARAAEAVRSNVRSRDVPGARFPGIAQDLSFLESAAAGMRNIEVALSAGDSNVTAQRIRDLLSSLSERQPI